MNKEEIKKFIDGFKNKRNKTIVIIDYGNVDKWKESLGWKMGVKELS